MGLIREAVGSTRQWCAVAWLTLALGAGCGTAPEVSEPADRATPAAGDSLPEGEWFVESASTLGLDFVHFNGMSGEFYMPEILPPGCGLLDYDNDGDLDVFLIQGTMLGPDKRPSDAVFPASATAFPESRLYRNELDPSDAGRGLRFVDVTDTAGIEVAGYAMGVATGDVNNDGCVDLYITSFGSNQLFRNNCDGTFTDITDVSGVGDPGWAVSAAFVDYDRDQWLDLYVGNYLHYTLDMDATCHNVAGGRDYCTPQVFRPQPDRLYRNQGDGTFVDVSAGALTGGAFGPALGVTTADFDGDGWVDIYVANDGTENQLWMNQGDGTFRNAGLLSGTALSGEGAAEGSMGVDAGDFDNDGDEDLFMTHLPLEGHNVYANKDGSGFFDDRSAGSGLDLATRGDTGFGTAWFDFDNDGWLDLFVANGAIVARSGRERDPFPYGEPNRLFRNMGDGKLEDVTARAGAALVSNDVSRGAAFGDIDNDGDVDILVANNSGPVRLMVNVVGNRKHWLGLRLVSPVANRPVLGAVARAARSGQPTLTRRVRADGSYASANDPRVLFGLGDSDVPPQVTVRWPDGSEDVWMDVAIDQWTTLRQGAGSP